MQVSQIFIEPKNKASVGLFRPRAMRMITLLQQG